MPLLQRLLRPCHAKPPLHHLLWMGGAHTRECNAFIEQVVVPLKSGKSLAPRTRGFWCWSVTSAAPHIREWLLKLALEPFRAKCPGRHLRHGCMWEELHRHERQWARARRELRRLWYHHATELPLRIWQAEPAMQGELLMGQFRRLPTLGRCSGPTALPPELWAHVAQWAVDGVEAAFVWRHVAGGAWGAALDLFLQRQWPRLPSLSALLPWLDCSFLVTWHTNEGGVEQRPYTAPLSGSGKRFRMCLQWSSGKLTDVPSDESLAELGVPWTVRDIWCNITPGNARPCALLRA